MSPGHLAPSPAAITSYLFNKIKTCLVRPIEGRGDKSDLRAAAREGQPGAGLEATCAVSGGQGPSFPWLASHAGGPGSGTASAPDCSRHFLGLPLVSFPARLLVAGSWLWLGKDSKGKAPAGTSVL